MGIPLGSQFTVQTGLSLDDRDSVADLTARDAIAALRRWEGMRVYVVAEVKTYKLSGGITNGDWIVEGGIDTTEFITYLYGDSGTDGSIRINTTDGTFTLEKRVAGVWTFMGSFAA
jgi:hypothetical protein